MCLADMDSAADNALTHCSYGSWQPRYTAVTAASRVMDLDQAVVDFLQEDGLVLPEESHALPQRAKPSDIIVEGVDYDPEDLYDNKDSDSSNGSAKSRAAMDPESRPGQNAHESGSSSDSDSESHSDSDSEEDALPWPQRFPGLYAAVAAAISELGGAVAPRLNWSSPTDALWLSSSNSLRCTHPDEVLLLLKGSDRVAHDLKQLQQLQQPSSTQQQQQQHAQHSHQDHIQQAAHTSTPADHTTSSSSSLPCPAQLVLRAWCVMQPEWEFRAFVCQHRLVAISQRDPSQHFPQLAGVTAEAEPRDSISSSGGGSSIVARLLDFHRRHIGCSFPVDSYAMDVYVPPSGAIRLLDFSPISPTTSPLCFTWEELPYPHMQQQPGGDHHHQQQQQQQHIITSAESSDTQGNQQQQGQQQGEQQQHGGSPSSPAIQFRVVEHEGMIMPGTRVATGMPYDMLGLPDAVGAVMAAMQQQGLH